MMNIPISMPFFLIAKSLVAANYAGKILPIAATIVDYVNGGAGRIAGVADRQGTPILPVRCRVRLHRRVDGLVVAETWSDASGNFHFHNIAIQPYYITAFDPTGQSNAVIADLILPEPI